MLIKIVKRLTIHSSIAGVILSVTIFFMMSHYQLSLVDFVNKVAQKLQMTSPYNTLLPHSKKYLTTTSPNSINMAHPKIILTKLRGWDGLSTPDFYHQRLANLERSKLGFSINCKPLNIRNLLHCYLAKPSAENLKKLEHGVMNYRFKMPNNSSQYGNAWQFSLILDIAKSSPTFSANVSQQINLKIINILNHYLKLLDGGGASLWHGRSSLAANAFLLASVLSVNTVEENQLYQRAYGHFYDVYRAISATETWPEGYNYWINTRALPLVLALSALKNQQIDVFESTKIHQTLTRIGLWHIYLTRPDFKIEGWGDEGPRTDLKDESLKVIDAISQITQESAIYSFANQIREHYKASGYYVSYRWLLPLLYQYEQPLGTPLLPKSELFGPHFTNHLSVRSDWSPQQTFITYRAGHTFTHHQHYDAGHFSIFKGKPLAVNASQYNGNVFSDNRMNFAIRTIAKNSLLIQNPNESVQPHRRFTQNVAPGGQRIVMPVGGSITSFEHWKSQLYNGKHLAGATLLNYQYQPDLFTAIRSDLTPAYNSVRYSAPGNKAKIKRVARTFVYLNRFDMVLINDRVLTTEPYKVKWLLHTVNQPEMVQTTLLKGSNDNGILSSDHKVLLINNGQSTMRMDVLAPEHSNALLIGGDDYRYYVESDGDDAAFNGEIFNQGVQDRPWYDLAKWRIELSGQSKQLDNHFLVALQPRLKGQKLRAIVPKLIKHPYAGVAVFNELLVISAVKSDALSIPLPGNISTLAIFVERSSLLTFTDTNLRTVTLNQGFNYIHLTDKAGGLLIIETSKSL